MPTVEPPVEAPVVEIPIIDEAGGISPLAIMQDAPQLWQSDGVPEFNQYYQAFVNELRTNYPAPIADAFEASMSPVVTSINDGVITPAQAEEFWRWMNYNKGTTSIPNDATTTSSITGYLSSWIIEQSGLSPTGPLPPVTPAPTPPAAVHPAPTLAPNPPPAPPLPVPTPAQKAVVSQSVGVTGHTVTGTLMQGTSAAQVSASLAATAVDTLQVTARVIDAFLPGMAPGQVPEALKQLNQAVHVLEDQLNVLRSTTTGHAQASLSQQITTLQDLMRQVQDAITNLQAQLAEKAPSALETSVDANTSAITSLDATVGTITGVSIPALASGLGSLTSTVGALDTEVKTQVEPQLEQTTKTAQDTAQMLSGTDKECLDKLCDSEGNVTDPIQEGGATPSLLKGLGNLLSKGFELGALIALADGIFSIFDAKAAVQGVVSDTEVIAAWATSAASYIESSSDWRGPL